MSKAAVFSHLKKFPPPQKTVLQDLREEIEISLPFAEQVIKYGIPTFTISGVPVIGFDGYKKHNSIFPYSGSFTQRLAVELKNYEQTKGSIHFDIAKSFPKSLLRKILKERISQINDSYPKKSGEFLEFYDNGALKAKGRFKNGKLHGSWQWFRRTGVIMRSGSFNDGVQSGTWITFDVRGKIYKETEFKS